MSAVCCAGPCGRVLVGEDDVGWYYQVSVQSAEIPGLTFMDRVHECGDPPRPHVVAAAT